jgi:hypothetical protein
VAVGGAIEDVVEAVRDACDMAERLVGDADWLFFRLTRNGPKWRNWQFLIPSRSCADMLSKAITKSREAR